jgi:hypothetical protein
LEPRRKNSAASSAHGGGVQRVQPGGWWLSRHGYRCPSALLHAATSRSSSAAPPLANDAGMSSSPHASPHAPAQPPQPSASCGRSASRKLRSDAAVSSLLLSRASSGAPAPQADVSSAVASCSADASSRQSSNSRRSMAARRTAWRRRAWRDADAAAWRETQQRRGTAAVWDC